MRIYLFCLLSILIAVGNTEETADITQTVVHIDAGESETVCFSGAPNPLNIWKIHVYNISSYQSLPSFDIDSPDSSLLRMGSYLYERVSGKTGINSNNMYETVKYFKEKSVVAYLSPYGQTCFNITCPASRTVNGLDVMISSYQEYDSFCLVRLILGFFLLVFSSRLSKSKPFYYITAASLSAVIGLLLIIIYIMKKLQASNTAMGTVAVAYSFGISSLFRHSIINVLWKFCIEHYRLVLIYTSVFAFIGVIIVRLKVFSSTATNQSSLFEVVRWGLLIIALSLVLNSTASVVGSLLCFIAMIIIVEVVKKLGTWLKNICIHLRFKFLPPKHIYKTAEQYEKDRQEYTVKEMKKLRQYYIKNPNLLDRLHSCPKSSMMQFLSTGIDIIDTSAPYSELVSHCDSKQKDKDVMDYLYKQRNNRALFIQNGEYSQSSASVVSFTENDANSMLNTENDYYESDDEDCTELKKKNDPSIYQFDSDDGETNFFQPPRRYNKSRSVSKANSQRANADRINSTDGSRGRIDASERRKTLPSTNGFIPSANGWE